MTFTDVFIKKPVFATVLSLIILLVGAKSYFSLSVRLYPRIDASVVTVTVTYSGADAELMEGFVTTPIENALSGIDGIDYISSQSYAGESDITLYFNLGYDINVAVSDVNAKVSSVRKQLPTDIDDPVVQKKDPNATPTMYISFYNPTAKSELVTDYLERVIQPQLQTLNGIAEAEVYGFEYAMRIWLNPMLMSAHGITATDIEDTLLSQNLQAPSGTLKSAWQQLNVKTESGLETSKQFDNLVLRESDGHLVRLKEVGYSELGAKNTDFSMFSDTKPAVILAIVPSSTANPLDISREVNKILPSLTRDLPYGTTFQVVWDSSVFIEQSIQEVKKTIIEATLCVVGVVFLFLFSWRILLIPVVTIPLSLIGVCGIMLAMGYSINTITLLSMVLAIGMVVDDAIVVSENIHRHLAMGKTPLDAAIAGAREIQFAVISMTFTLAAVYAPIGFLTGLIGSLFKEFAFTLAGAVIISGFIALTLSPMMCSKIMKPEILQNRAAIYVHDTFDKIMHFYRKLLLNVLNHRRTILSGVGLILIASVIIFLKIPSELAPREDIGALYINILSPTSANVAYTEKYTKQIENILATVPEKEHLIRINYPNYAFQLLKLVDWSKRKRTADEIVDELTPKLWAIPGVMAFPYIPNMLPGAGSGVPVNFVVETTGDFSELDKVMQQLKAAAEKNPGFIHPDIAPKFDQDQINIKINRDKAGDLGIPVKEIGDSINIALGEPTINYFAIMGRSYDVITQLQPEFRNTPNALNLMYLRTSSENLVPLANFVTLKEVIQPQSLNHFQQLRSATLSANLAPNYTLGQALSFLQDVSTKIVPSNMQINYSDESRQYIQTAGTMGATFVFALVFIYLILAAQFESFRDPFIVLFSIPLSVFGALLALKFTGSTLNIYSEIGLVTLIGLISKHGILMVEFANQLQDEGRTVKEAIVEAASIRLRPILMTTGAMVLGAFPLAIATGASSISRRQIGVVIIGGMLIGTIFTLFVVPTIYTYMAHKRTAVKE